MIEQYRQEMELIHAPKELVDKTKMAMKREEELLQKKRQRRKAPPFWVPAAVAAAALLFGLFVTQFFGKRVLLETKPETNQNAILLEQLELMPEKIMPGVSKAEKEFQFYMIQDFPREFMSEISSTETVEEVTVHFFMDEKTGFYKAVFQWDSMNYLAISQTENKELMVEAIKSFMKSFRQMDDE